MRQHSELLPPVALGALNICWTRGMSAMCCGDLEMHVLVGKAVGRKRGGEGV